VRSGRIRHELADALDRAGQLEQLAREGARRSVGGVDEEEPRTRVVTVDTGDVTYTTRA